MGVKAGALGLVCSSHWLGHVLLQDGLSSRTYCYSVSWKASPFLARVLVGLEALEAAEIGLAFLLAIAESEIRTPEKCCRFIHNEQLHI